MKDISSIEVVCEDCGATIHSDCDLREVENIGEKRIYFECRYCESSSFRLRI